MRKKVLLDKTCEDLVRNNYDDKLTEILRIENWTKGEIESYITVLKKED